jgi:hypothetical protein
MEDLIAFTEEHFAALLPFTTLWRAGEHALRRVAAGCGHQDEVNAADLAYSSRQRASRSAPGRRN